MDKKKAQERFLQDFVRKIRRQAASVEAWKVLSPAGGIRVRIEGFARKGVVKKIGATNAFVEWDDPDTRIYMSMPTEVPLGWLIPVSEKDALNLFLSHPINFAELGG